MAWNGYFRYNNVEVVNVARTEAYAAHAGLSFFRPAFKSETLALVLGERYGMPFQDDPPWADPDHGESYGFYGLYPLDVQGIDDSTVASTITESPGTGGHVFTRRATRAIAFSGVLVGESECSVEYGLRWLREVLNNGRQPTNRQPSTRTVTFQPSSPFVHGPWVSPVFQPAHATSSVVGGSGCWGDGSDSTYTRNTFGTDGGYTGSDAVDGFLPTLTAMGVNPATVTNAEVHCRVASTEDGAFFGCAIGDNADYDASTVSATFQDASGFNEVGSTTGPVDLILPIASFSTLADVLASLNGPSPIINFNFPVGLTDFTVYEASIVLTVSALAVSPCQPIGCGGATLEFLSCEPVLDFSFSAPTVETERLIIDGGTAAAPGPEPVDGGTYDTPGTTIIDGGGPVVHDPSSSIAPPTFDFTECLPPYQRYFRGVTVTSGPVVTAKSVTSTNQAVWQVEFTAVCADPAEYGNITPLVTGFLDPDILDPYVGGVPSGGIWDADGFVTSDPECPEPFFAPVFDPTCPQLIPPPSVPSIAVGCVDFPTNYRRFMFTLPQQDIPAFGEVVPVLTIRTPDVEVRNLRIRFYPDRDTDQDPDDLCDFVSSAVFTYLPADSVVTFDGVAQQVHVLTPGFASRRGDSIVFGANGGPLQWPELSCGFAYVVTVDMPQTQEPPTVDLALVSKVV